MNSILTEEEKLSLKGKGILAQKQDGYFAIRFLSKVGYFSADDMIALANLAKKYGNGELSLTSRLTIEIPYIKESNLKDLLKEASLKGLVIGGAGPTVRAVVACKGSVCVHGLIDTRILGEKIENEFLGRVLPNKFKIGVFGCVNSYGKAQSNDLAVMPVKDLEKSEVEFLVFLGGRLGKKARLGTPIKKRFKEEELIDLIEIVIDYYNKNAVGKERFAEVIERIGFSNVENYIISEKLNKL